MRRLLIVCTLLSLALAGCDGDDGEKSDGDLTGDMDVDGADGTPDTDMPSDGVEIPDGDADMPDIPMGPPAVVGHSPADGATGVSIAETIQVDFNKPLDDLTVTLDNLQISPAISGDLFWDDASRRITFRPNVYLQRNTDYTVTVLAAIADDAGQTLGADVSFSFQTGDSTISPGDTSLYEANGETMTVTIDAPESPTRTYTLTTTQPLKDNLPAGQTTTFSEQTGQLTLRSGHDVFDALFAMAIEETRLNSVESIQDWGFNNGNGVPCSCFETGEKWNYVWTRDTAYAVHLGLPLVDPTRARNSLDFKLSAPKGGGTPQIVQDTGSGGSWPVSSDRVVWALGAMETIAFLDGAERTAFMARSLDAMQETIEHDRTRIFDPDTGLYRGEQSFLDWREQSYPSWTADDTVQLSMSSTLSTNVGHYVLLRSAAELAAEAGDTAASARYDGWADALSNAINDAFWLGDMYAAMILGGFDPSATHKYDLLGTALAVVTGVADGDRAATVMANYPHTAMGPPVLWPQQPLTPIYHNRGIWPFVTAYAVLAARAGGNDAVFDHDLESLVRGSALNLSNMENFEFTTQLPEFADGIYSGPVVNSRRQLWSVAGYLGAVVKGVFGQETHMDGIRFRPFVTPWLHNTYFANTTRVRLNNVKWRDVNLTVDLLLPLATGDETGGAYEIDAVYLNGTGVGDAILTTEDFAPGDNNIAIELRPSAAMPASMTVVTDLSDFRALWSPRDPNLTSVDGSTGQMVLTFDDAGEGGVEFNVYRDGVEVAQNVTSPWTDTQVQVDQATHCYTIETVFPTSGNRSHHAKPLCWWGDAFGNIDEILVHGFERDGGTWATTGGLPHWSGWGGATDTLAVPFYRPRFTGLHFIQLQYGNGAGSIDTGITAAVKTVHVEDANTGMLVAEGVVAMPHLADWNRWGDSSVLAVDLDADRVYRIAISDGMNMSYFAHFESYTAGNGGGPDPYNQVNIASMKVLPVVATDGGRSQGDLLPLDGSGDLAEFAVDQVISTGAELTATDRFAMTWDDDFLYLSVRTSAFDDAYKPFSLYIESATGPLGSAAPSVGVEYSNLTPSLPFTPTHLVSLRQLSDDGNASGPWNGIWVRENGNFVRQQGLQPGSEWWFDAAQDTLSFRVSRDAIGGPGRIRLAGHVVNAAVGNEWKNLVPAGHTPWAGGGSYYEIDLTQSTASSNWTLR